ncbi:MAG: hypothetical protein QXQ46_11775 [Thermoplasmatales archaeon]
MPFLISCIPEPTAFTGVQKELVGEISAEEVEGELFYLTDNNGWSFIEVYFTGHGGAGFVLLESVYYLCMLGSLHAS